MQIEIHEWQRRLIQYNSSCTNSIKFHNCNTCARYTAHHLHGTFSNSQHSPEKFICFKCIQLKILLCTFASAHKQYPIKLCVELLLNHFKIYLTGRKAFNMSLDYSHSLSILCGLHWIFWICGRILLLCFDSGRLIGCMDALLDVRCRCMLWFKVQLQVSAAS